MRNKISGEVKGIIEKNNFITAMMNISTSGFAIWVPGDDSIFYMDDTASKIFKSIGKPEKINNLNQVLNRKEINKLRKGLAVVTVCGNDKFEFSAVKSGNHALIGINEITSADAIRKESELLKKLNNKLQQVYENYNDDTICIADKDGTVEYSGEACERHCGIKAKDIVGKNMLELEQQKYFYPSATGRVLKTGKPEVVMSNTLIGVTLITIGVPVFDENGEIKKVIAISRDFSNELEIASLLVDVHKDIDEDKVTQEKTIITCSNKVYSIMTLLKMVAPSDSTVLITGETGTGKGVFAKYIHNNSSRSDKPFYSINCGSIAENIIEAELYGYEPNTFTGADSGGRKGLFEIAHKGTIFLDEIGELPMSQQVKLLHVLQEKSFMRVGGREYVDVDIRIIAATNKNLESMVKKGMFREDLYYRLNIINVNVPPLRNRPEDIPLLLRHFLNRMNEHNNSHKEISSEAIETLTGYLWPGNVRELENLIEMLSLTVQDHIIDTFHLPEKIINWMNEKNDSFNPVSVNRIAPLKDALKNAEKQMVELALEQTGGNQLKAAELLGVDRSTITRKISQYNLK